MGLAVPPWLLWMASGHLSHGFSSAAGSSLRLALDDSSSFPLPLVAFSSLHVGGFWDDVLTPAQLASSGWLGLALARSLVPKCRISPQSPPRGTAMTMTFTGRLRSTAPSFPRPRAPPASPTSTEAASPNPPRTRHSWETCPTMSRKSPSRISSEGLM